MPFKFTYSDVESIIKYRNNIVHRSVSNINFMNQIDYYTKCINIINELGKKINVYEFDIFINIGIKGIYISDDDIIN